MSEDSRRRHSRTERFLTFLVISLVVFHNGMLWASSYYHDNQSPYIQCIYAICFFIPVILFIRLIFRYRTDKRKQRASNVEDDCLDMPDDTRPVKKNWSYTFFSITLMMLGTGIYVLSAYIGHDQHLLGPTIGFSLTVAGFIYTIVEYVMDKREQRASNPPPP